MKEKTVSENLDKMFGNRESARDIKQAILLAQTGRLTDEVIERYRAMKEAEQEALRQQFTELNPSYAFDYPKETETIVISKENIENDIISELGQRGDDTRSQTGRELSNIECGGDENVVSIHEK